MRKLLGARERLGNAAVLADVLYESRDRFARKLVINVGINDGVRAGSPVIDDGGVVGQITRAFNETSEVTLLTDKDQSIPVQILRNGLRGVAFGGAEPGTLDLRFMAPNADVVDGDVATTSGIDGVYPSGLMVATVSRVERAAKDQFARIVMSPVAGIESNKHLLVLLVEPAKLACRPPPLSQPPARARANEPYVSTDSTRSPARPAGVRGWLGSNFALRPTDPIEIPGTRMGYRPQYLLRPANPLFIWASLIAALVINLLPWGRTPLVPDVLAITLVFWNIHQPRRVGIGAAFAFGLLMDVHEAALFGEHALAYTLISYGAITLHRRILWFPLGAQALHVFPLLLIAQLASLAIRMWVGGTWPGWIYFGESGVGAVLWPLISWVLLAPQRRPTDRDETRPL